MSIALSPKIRVAVLRGGPSSEYDVSLKTGANILSLLREHSQYEPVDIFISKTGEWHKEGLVHDPIRALKHVDVVWNALHGTYGEDGQVQRLLERLGIPFTGSSAFSSALSMDKHHTKQAYAQVGLRMPQHELVVDKLDPQVVAHVFSNYVFPVVVKPVNAGSSMGVSLAYSVPEIESAVTSALKHSNRVMIEEFVRGKEATCGVVEGLRGEDIYALLPVEIRKSQGQHLFDYDSKYSGETEEVCPGNFTESERKLIESMAKDAHRTLGLRHYSRSDFIVTSRGNVYILETNSLPGFTSESLLPKSIHAVGWHPREFVDHCINLALL